LNALNEFPKKKDDGAGILVKREGRGFTYLPKKIKALEKEKSTGLTRAAWGDQWPGRGLILGKKGKGVGFSGKRERESSLSTKKEEITREERKRAA